MRPLEAAARNFAKITSGGFALSSEMHILSI
jgi:hypothetical protein